MRFPGPLTARAFASLPSIAEAEAVGSAGGTSLLKALQTQDAGLQRLYDGQWPLKDPIEFVKVDAAVACPPADLCCDVACCGGTLGLLLATALQLKGHQVVVVEAGPLQGRKQDWNTSAEELQQLIEAGVLDASELPLVAPLQFGPMECRFGPSPSFQLELSGVLDVAVSPIALLNCVRKRFEAAGGIVLERTPVQEVTIHTDGAVVALRSSSEQNLGAPRSLHARIVVDAMGHRSPIALQQRAGQRPDGVCVQVGSCARGPWVSQWDKKGDFFVTADHARRRKDARVQYFWQAFPSSGSASERSTYLFSYFRPSQGNPSLIDVMEDYWRALPDYQKIGGGLEQVDVERIVFGWFPTYKSNSPLAPRFDRVLSVGDASAVQSPISFGGFCAMLRHLPRYTRGLDLALNQDRLSARDLSLLAPYFPNLGTAWMSAAAMTAQRVEKSGSSTKAGKAGATSEGASTEAYTLVNELLEGNFQVMSDLPRADALRFFRDVTTLSTLSAVLVGQTVTMAPLLPKVVAELVAPLELAEFSGHFAMLGLYTVLHVAADACDLRTMSKDKFVLSCALDALSFGSGLDSQSPKPPTKKPVVSKQERQGKDLPWWQRPPPTWPPRIDDPSLVAGDIFAVYAAAYAAQSAWLSLTGRGVEWQGEGAALACSWLVAGAVTNAWDPTAVLPSLGLRNAVACVLRTAVDAASTRMVLALSSAVVVQKPVDIPLITLELGLSLAAMTLWRTLATWSNPDQR